MKIKSIVFGIVLGVSSIALADRVDTWLASTVSVSSVLLVRQPGGGCGVQATASVTNSLGGTKVLTSALTNVGGANLVTCLDILDTKAPVLFKTDQGL